jgi:predicted transposase YbfD/YdcC
VASIARPVDVEIFALDGKTVRGSSDRDTRTLEEHGRPLGALHLRRNFCVSAWASEQRLVLAQKLMLAQKAVDEKTNEITVLPDLLGLLEIEGCLVTIDAMGTQTDIAEAIVDRGGDYVLALKRNRKRLYDDVRTFFEESANRGFLGIDHDADRQVDGGHGRIELRRCWATEDIGWLDRRDQ